MDPLLFPLPDFRLADDCQPTVVPPPVFLSFYSVSLFAILRFSQEKTGRILAGGTGNPQLQTERRTDRSSTAEEARRSSWLNDLWKSCREANVARLVSSTASPQTARAQSYQLRAHRSKAQSQQPTPHPHAYISSALVLPSHPPLLTHSYRIPPNSRSLPSAPFC